MELIPCPLCGTPVNEWKLIDRTSLAKGKWEWTVADDEYLGEYWKCNICGEHSYIKYNFCPNCGAKMDGGQEE